MHQFLLKHSQSCCPLQELERVKTRAETLTAENESLLAENTIVAKQRQCHAEHAQLLIRENQRLSQQVQALKAARAVELLQASREAEQVKGPAPQQARVPQAAGGQQAAESGPTGRAGQRQQSRPPVRKKVVQPLQPSRREVLAEVQHMRSSSRQTP